MKRYLLALLISLPLAAQAQTDELRKQYDAFKQQAEQEYGSFRDEANNEYAEFLKRAWMEYKTLPAIPKPKDETVPPVVMPEEDKDEPINDRSVPIKDVVTTPKIEPQPMPVVPIYEQEQEDKVVEFTLYGTPCKVRFNDKSRFALGDCSNERLAEAWKYLSDGACDNTIRDCLELRINLKLSDWAYLNLLNSFAEAALGSGDEATMLMAYIYCQSGYGMRLARANGHLRMLFASKHNIYDMGYFRIDDMNYYPFNCKEDGKMEICNAVFPNEKPLSLMLTTQQGFAYKASEQRTLTSNMYQSVSVTTQVNVNLMDFYSSYPSSEINGNFMTRWAMYANAPVDKNTTEKLYPALRKRIEGLSEKEAVGRLLSWVQTAFTYELDDKVWGGDRAFFAEETLYYPYCDCEDRSILLTRLVRDLLGLDCILIYYPGHLASAVCFNEQVKGDYITLNNRRFIVCDATYIGAPVGLTMLGMDNKTASVIMLNR